MKISDVMAKAVISCGPATNLAAAAALMWDNDCGALPVVDERGIVTGMITDRDICIAAGTRNQRPSDLTASDVMSGRVLACGPDDDLRVTLKTMAKARVRRVPVVTKEGALVGILSLDEVALRAQHHHGSDRPGVSYEDVMNTLRAVCGHDWRTGYRTAA